MKKWLWTVLMTMNPEIAIIGAGPAGLTAAVILHRHGRAVRVYEADESPAHRGQGGTLDLHEDKAQIALKNAGLLEQFRAIARHEDQESKDVDPFSGEVQLGDQREDEKLDRPEIDRGVLRDLLLSALPSDVVVWNHRLVTITTSEEGRQVLLFEGGQSATCDIVVGADGAWSRVRAAQTTSEPFYTGVTFLEGWIDKPTKAQSEFVGHGTLFSFGGPEAIFAQRNGQGRICVYAAVKRSRQWLSEQLEVAPPSKVVRRIYEKWSPKLLDLLEGCCGFAERPIFSFRSDYSWSSHAGRALIGDAAHLMPPVGLGVNLAMLDASDLALALIEEPNWNLALQRAETQINGRAKEAMKDAVPGFLSWFGSEFE